MKDKQQQPITKLNQIITALEVKGYDKEVKAKGMKFKDIIAMLEE